MKKTELSTAKRELLNKWLGGQASESSSHIPLRIDAGHIPLSFTQQRQLFLELLKPGTAVNNLSVCIELNGPLDRDALEKCSNTILSRHEILRTQFTFDHGLPAPEILPELRITIPVIRVNQSGNPNNLTDATRLAEKLALQPFDLARAPLIRINLYELGDCRHLMAVIIHHSIADGWSLGIFLNELITSYQNKTNGSSELLPQLPIQYADFTCWQIDSLKGDIFQHSLLYWKRQLKGDLPILELPVDRRRSAQQTFFGGTHRFDIPLPLTRELENIGQAEDATLFMVLLTAYFILLHKYSGQSDIIVGTPIAGRNSPELMNLIGPFINTLALRIDISGNPSFRQLLKRVRATCLEAYANQDLPFEKIVEELKPKRDLSHSPIFQAVFNMRNSPMPKIELPELELKIIEIDRGVSEFDLTLMTSNAGDSYQCTVEYNKDLFESSTIQRMFTAFAMLLRSAIKFPDSPVSSLRLTPEMDSNNFGLNGNYANFPSEKCVHQLFEEQVEKTPDAIAVKFGTSSLTYAQLNNSANAIAQTIRSRGVQPNTTVGVCMERSAEIIAALLGIHKAGCIYVPIHPSFPSERIKFIVTDADIKIVITNIPIDFEGLDLLIINTNEFSEADGDLANPPARSTSGNPAYIIYTSGSTGNPKGVMVPHSALTNLLWSMKACPGIENNDVLLSVTSITFDIAALELFLPLIVGATVVIADKDMIVNPFKLGEAINHHSVTIMQATPATWQMLLDSGWKGQPKLKALCGGDVLTRKLADKLVDHTGTLWNMYGPTETTIWSTLGKVERDSAISVGHPIHNTQAYILDGNLAPVPVGVYGELYLGGEGLAIGYLNNQELTDQKFIYNGFDLNSSGRLFKTGDRARYLFDYSIEILGRLDDQIKINGYRINLNEISAALLEHPSITEAVVLTHSAGHDRKSLIAYYVLNEDRNLDRDDLKDFLKSKLPHYMVPGVFICLDDLPLTANGKVDRSALPVPQHNGHDLNYAAPRNDEERLLVRIWQEILEVEPIGIHDNYFNLGGASIQSIQIVTRASKMGLQFNPEDIFECQTIAELAKKSEQLQ